MKRLLLYDLENVGSVGKHAREDVRQESASSNVVALVVSGGGLAVLGREEGREYTFEDLIADAGSAARAIWSDARDFALEATLVLNMPEAVDMSLSRMVREAGTQESAGEFAEVVLLSEDQGLRDDIDACIREAAPGWGGFEPTPEQWWRWRQPRRQGPLEREHRVVGKVLPALRREGGPTIVLDSSRALAPWLSTPTQVKGTLAEVAQQVEERPERLTQIGITRTSVRGVARFVELAISRSPTFRGAVPDDGLEVTGSAELPPDGSDVTVEAASLPQGAVRLQWGKPLTTRTVRTHLWLPLLRQLKKRGLPRLRPDGSIDDQHLLAGPERKGGQTTVRFYRLGTRDKVACAVEAAASKVGPSLWWYLPQRKEPATAKLYVETDALVATSQSLGRVAASAVIVEGAVHLRAPEPQGPLSMREGAAHMFLGEAADERGNLFAVLCTNGPLRTGGTIRGTPIAKVLRAPPAAARLGRIWADLRRFPIIVAT